jgi:DNA repair protein RadC
MMAPPHRVAPRSGGLPANDAMTESLIVSPIRLRDIPDEDRPRERLSRLGPSALSNEELLALLLGTGSPGESVLERARRLLASHGGLAGLAGVSGAELRRERGIKEARAAAIEAARASLMPRSRPSR